MNVGVFNVAKLFELLVLVEAIEIEDDNDSFCDRMVNLGVSGSSPLPTPLKRAKEEDDLQVPTGAC